MERINFMQLFQALPTQSDKIHHFLQFLPRCGQHAFDCFLDVLESGSPWLASKLREKHEQHIEQCQKSKLEQLPVIKVKTLTVTSGSI